MKGNHRSVAFVVVSLWLTAVPLVSAQSPTSGTINGIVTDNTGAVLPGVTVTATSPNLMGSQTAVTNDKGQYRFPLLPPGDYKLTYELAGFGRVVREGIHIAVGFAAEVDVSLQLSSLQESVTVTGQSPLIDTQNTSVQNHFGAELLKTIPNARDIWSLMAEAPGMTVTRFDVGGSTAGTQTGYSAYGMSGQNRVQIDGVNTTEGTAAAGFYFDYGAFDEVQLGVDSNDASMPVAGVLINTVIKSGGNQFRGEIYNDYENKRLQGQNIDDRQRRLGAGQGSRMLKYYDPNGNIGGPLQRDKLWFFVSLRNQNIVTTTTGFPVEKPSAEAPFQTKLQNGTYKLTYQLNQNNRLSHYIQYGRKLQPHRDASSTRYSDAVYFQDSGSWAGNVEWSDIRGPRFFMTLRAASFGYNWPNSPYGVTGKINEDVDFRRVENLTNDVKGGYPGYRYDRRRWTGEWTGTVYREDLIGADHSLKMGWLSEFESFEDQEYGPRDFYQLTFNSPEGSPDFTTPYRVTIYNRPYISKDEQKHHGAYVSDQIRFVKNVTVNAGIRWDYYDTGYPEQKIAMGPWTPFFYQGVALPNGYAFPVSPWADLSVPSQWGVVKYPHLIAPRLSVAWDLRGNGRTVLKANWGRYQVNPGTASDQINPVQSATATFDWIDRDGDRLFTPGELGTFRSGSPPGTLAVTYDPGIGHPYSDDTSVALERQLGNIGTRTAFVYKRSENNYTNIEQARLGSFYTDRRTAVDPGVDGIVGTGDDGTFSYWDIPAGFVLPPSRAIRTTRRDNESRTKNIDFTVAKRMSSRWSLVGNFLYTWSYSHSVVQNPNQELDNPQNTTLWTFKLFGTYMAPWDLAVTPVLRHQAGDPLVRNLQITTRVGSTTFPVEPIGTYREDNVTIFDTRLERRFRFNGRREVGLFFDAFNIFNSNAAQSQDNIVGRRTVTLDDGEVVNYQRFLRPTVIIGPRVYRLGFKIAF